MTVKVGSGCSDGNGFQVAKRPPPFLGVQHARCPPTTQRVCVIKAAWDDCRLLGMCFKKSNECSRSSPGKHGKVAGTSARSLPDIVALTLQSQNRPRKVGWRSCFKNPKVYSHSSSGNLGKPTVFSARNPPSIVAQTVATRVLHTTRSPSPNDVGGSHHSQS